MKNNNFSNESMGSSNGFQISEGDSLNNDVLAPANSKTLEATEEPSLDEILASIKIDKILSKEELRDGVIINTRKHYVCCRDDYYQDIWDSGLQIVGNYYIKK